MVFRITPSLGPDLEQFDTDFWFDLTGVDSPLPGAAVLGSDGHKYVFAKAGAAIATAGTDVIINETTWVAAVGAGTYETTVAAIPINAWTWFRQIAL